MSDQSAPAGERGRVGRYVVTLNAGSSSIKFALFEASGEEPPNVATGIVEMLPEGRRIAVQDGAGETTHEASWTEKGRAPFHVDALGRIFEWYQVSFPAAQIAAVASRRAWRPSLHGSRHHQRRGDAISASARAACAASRAAQYRQILAARDAWPGVPQIACFDTAFHRAHPFVNDVFAIPRRFFEEGVRRYGFHGLSYEYVTGRLRQIAPYHAAGRVVVGHLGNGASMCAIRDGRSVASSMGFTALDGLPMGTRCGQLDPGVVLYLMQEEGMSAEEISELLYHESGLKGLSGISHDMRELEASDKPEAHEAIEYFVFQNPP